MKIINPNKLPEAVIRAIQPYDYPPDPKRMSVTDLINPPLVRKLKIEYWESLYEVAEEAAWRLLGTGLHLLLAKAAPHHGLTEEKLTVATHGHTLVGKLDRLEYIETAQMSGNGSALISIEGILYDYKVTSVWSIIYPRSRIEWEQQLNIYAYILRKNGYSVDKIQAIVFLRDYKPSEKLKYDDYPESRITTVDFRLWTPEEQDAFVDMRFKKHERVDLCTAEEKWQDPDVYAVMEKGKKRATKLCVSNEEANQYIANVKTKKDYDIVKREGSCKRCIGYCLVKDVCPFGQTLKTTEIEEE